MLEQYTNGTILNSKKIYKYDPNGNKIESWSYDYSDPTTKLYIYRKDPKNKTTETTFYNLNGEIIYKATTKENDNGDQIECLSYPMPSNKNTKAIDKDNNQLYVSTYKFKYDHENNWIEKVTFENLIPLGIEIREIIYY